MNKQRQVPAWQQAIIDKCYHPTGVWEEFTLSAVENSAAERFAEIVRKFGDRPLCVYNKSGWRD